MRRLIRQCASIGLVLLGCLLMSTVARAGQGFLPMWEARSPEGVPVYLFGSIHVCNATCFPLPVQALRRLSESKLLVLEMDPQKPGVQRSLMVASVLPPGQRLSALLPAEDWHALSRLAAELGFPAEMLEPMQPWMAGMMLSVWAAQQAGYESSQGIDLAFLVRARELGLRVEELESVEIQLAALASGTQAEQFEALRVGVNQLQGGGFTAYFERMLKAWKQGNAPALEEVVHEGMPKDSSLTRALLEERNHRMSGKLIASMRDAQARFVVVGLAHLLGPEGLPALLAKHGFAVRQIRHDEP